VFTCTGLPREATSSIGIQTTATTAEDFQTQLAALGNAFFDDLGPDLSDSWHLARVDGELGQAGDPIIVTAIFGSQFGNAGASTSPQVALLIEKRSAVGGRKNRGRMYIPGIPEAGVSPAGNLETGYAAAVTSDVADLFGDLVTVDGVDNLVIFHGTSLTPTHISSLTLDPQVATQRRRLR
jgi:hypothetical protein